MNETLLKNSADKGFNRVPVVREVLADTETPLSIYLKLGKGSHSYFFESIQGGEKWGRFSVIGLPCSTIIRIVGELITIEENGKVIDEITTADPFSFIEEFKSRYKVAELEDSQAYSAYTGGLVGYFGYDSVRYVETSVGQSTAADKIKTPDILLMVSEEVVVFDNLRGTLAFVINVDPTLPDAYQNSQRRLDQLQAKMNEPSVLPEQLPGPVMTESDITFNFQQADFKNGVAKIKDYIVAGDVMQVVLAQRMSVDFVGDPLNVYRALRYLNPSPYMVYFDMGDHTVVSASPEILARVEDGKITVRPLAGTRKRGKTEQEDTALEKELLADSKELAEHLMLIDLSRNDSGRVSKTGSVEVTRTMFVERYSHVMHIASIVESEIRDDKTALDVLKSTLPVGTLSGAPKVRAMQIIDELEPVKRGVYGGAMGYLGWNNSMDMAIAIRTALVKDGQLHVQAGAGIVADSDPDSEWEETLSKARALIKALQMAQNKLTIE